MSTRDIAVQKAATFRAHIVAAEKELDEAIELAKTVGVPGVLDALLLIKSRMDKAHLAANAAAHRLALAFGDQVQVYSGGDGDKPGDPPPGP